jgi:uncharacterized protein YggE
MTDAMVGAGLSREDVQTTDVSIQPQYAPDGRVISGYRATNSVLAGMKLTDVITITEASSRDDNPKVAAGAASGATGCVTASWAGSLPGRRRTGPRRRR